MLRTAHTQVEANIALTVRWYLEFMVITVIKIRCIQYFSEVEQVWFLGKWHQPVNKKCVYQATLTKLCILFWASNRNTIQFCTAQTPSVDCWAKLTSWVPYYCASVCILYIRHSRPHSSPYSRDYHINRGLWILISIQSCVKDSVKCIILITMALQVKGDCRVFRY